MPNTREIPPPPPPELCWSKGGLFFDGDEPLWARAIWISVALAFVAGIIWGYCKIGDVERERHLFVARCIEFQTSKRCEELFYYRREDLVQGRK